MIREQELLAGASAMKFEYVTCGACGADDWREYATGKDYEYETSHDEFRMVECRACSNVYLNPRPSKEELSRIYPPTYYSYNYDEAVNPVARWAKERLDYLKAKSWMKWVKNPKPCFLDVGCGDGRYLKMLHRMGVPKDQLYGVEMSEAGMAALNADGYRGLSGRIEDVEAELPSESFDLIVLLQVLEHVEDPRATISSLARLLKKGGTLIVETPNTKSLDAKLFRRSYWGGYHFPRHWNLFNVETLTRVIEANGLNVEAHSFLPGHSFWIFSLHHLMADGWQRPRPARFFNPLQNVPLLSLFTGFDMMRARFGFSTSNMQLVAVKS